MGSVCRRPWCNPADVSILIEFCQLVGKVNELVHELKEFWRLRLPG